MEGVVPHERVIVEWMGRYSPEEITAGIDAFLPSLRRHPWKFSNTSRGFSDAVKYVSGILRNRAEARLA